MLGTNDRTLQPQNGEQNYRHMTGVAYFANVARPWSLRGYGTELSASNKASERNILQMPSFGIMALPLIAMPQYNLQTKRILSSNVVLPSGVAQQ